MKCPACQCRGRMQGFSLLEVLVAFSILAMVMGTLMQVFSGGLRNVGLAREYAQATNIARNQLNAVGLEIPLQPGQLQGESGSFQWTLLIQPYQEASPPVPLPVSSPANAGLMHLRVVVEWAEGGQPPRSVMLDSLRLFPRRPS